MEYVKSINNILQIVFINICLYIILIKITNYKHNNKIKMLIVFIFSIIEAIVMDIINKYVSTLIALLSIYFIHSGIIAKIINKKIGYTIIVTFISLTIVYSVYIISVLISSIILKLIEPNIQEENIKILIGGIFLECLTLHNIFKIKRFSNGIAFLRNKEKVNYIGIVGVTFIGIALLIYSKVGVHNGFWTNTYLCTGILIEAVCMTIWIRRKITKYYKQKLKEKTIEELENEIKQKDEEISRVLKENREIATINHKYSNRIQALEKFSAEILSKPEIIENMKVEFGVDFSSLDKQIKDISREYTKEINEKVKYNSNIQKTGIFGIDNILEYMNSKAIKNNIAFDVKINCIIIDMIDKVIEQNKLETLLGDHIKDAIIAINSSENSYREILTTIGITEDCYEICIYDTGIEFEIETLLKLGTEAVTTHKNTGGSGIGFMTTFETLKETKASLIIEEKHPMNNTDYTKSVKIRFDGKNEYKVCSYRAEEIKNRAEGDKRIILTEM